MSVYTVDASVFISALIPTERDHPTSHACLDALRAAGDSLACSTLVLGELVILGSQRLLSDARRGVPRRRRPVRPVGTRDVWTAKDATPAPTAQVREGHDTCTSRRCGKTRKGVRAFRVSFVVFVVQIAAPSFVAPVRAGV